MNVNKPLIQYIDMTGPTRCRKGGQLYDLSEQVPVFKYCGRENANAHTGAMVFDVPEMKGDARARLEKRSLILQSYLTLKELPEAEPGWLCVTLRGSATRGRVTSLTD